MSGTKRWFRVQAIGVVRRPDSERTAPDRFFDPAVESVIEIDPRWAEGLQGIEEYSHLVVLFFLDRATRRRASGETTNPAGRADLPGWWFLGDTHTQTP